MNVGKSPFTAESKEFSRMKESFVESLPTFLRPISHQLLEVGFTVHLSSLIASSDDQSGIEDTRLSLQYDVPKDK